ncbi:MAG: hypothetical protein KAS97_09325 [Candidatus Aminicenantes bacterium]|nr:hypothetical protein [Candidatus Aminicenantes bacterium]
MAKDRKERDERYERKSNRLFAWSDLLRSVSRVLWILVVLILVAGLGKMFLFKSSKDITPPPPIEKPVVVEIDWAGVNSEVREFLKESRERSEKLAQIKLSKWTGELMTRVDTDFLEWYFSYWTQQSIGIKGLLAQIWHWVDSDSPSAVEKITEDVQQEFSNRVLRPKIAQLELERMINEIMNDYSTFLSSKLESIPGKYKIKSVDWDRFLRDIAVITSNVSGDREISLTLKTLVGAGAGGALVLFRSLKPVFTKIGSKISAKLSSKAAARLATKTGGKVAMRAGGKFAGTLIAVGIIIWDVWDHHNTKKKAMPVLRKNIEDYFSELKMSILFDPEYGIMTIIYGMEKNIVDSINK